MIGYRKLSYPSVTRVIRIEEAICIEVEGCIGAVYHHVVSPSRPSVLVRLHIRSSKVLVFFGTELSPVIDNQLFQLLGRQMARHYPFDAVHNDSYLW